MLSLQRQLLHALAAPVCAAQLSPSPGLPEPQGLSQKGSPGLAAFHSAKSQGCRLSPPLSVASPASAAAPTAQGLSLP